MRRALPLALAVALAASSAGSALEAQTLTFTRVGDGPIAFSGKTYVWCGSWEPDVKVPALRVLLVPRRHDRSYWLLSGVLKDIRRSPRVHFPVGFVWNRPKGAELFVYDRPTKNEASSETEKAKGVVTFSRVTCRRGQNVVVSASGVLGSEFGDGKPIRVTGTFRGVVGPPPRGFR